MYPRPWWFSWTPARPILVDLAVCTLFVVSLGCGGSGIAPTPAALRGVVLSGQQPVSGATIQLYAAGAAGYGSAATALLSTAVTTGTKGSFAIATGDYSCPAAASEVYLVATGGNPGLPQGTRNEALALMAALGPCGNLTSSTQVVINEVTTVASVWALAPFMSAGAGANLGTSSTNTQGLANAFATVDNLVNTTTGTAPGPNLPTGATAPTSKLNTLADVLAPCVNSNGDTGECRFLFVTAAPNGGSLPTNTIDAALEIAQNPGSYASLLYYLATDSPPYSPPFQPTLSGPPTDWTVALNYPANTPASSSESGLALLSPLAIDRSGNVWFIGGSGSLSQFSNTGSVISPSSGYTGGGLSNSGHNFDPLAIDDSGNVWVANSLSSSLSEFSGKGSPVSPSTGYTGGGLSYLFALAIDASGNAWVVNDDSGSVSEFANNGSPISPSTGYLGDPPCIVPPPFSCFLPFYMGNLTAIAIDGSGNVFVANEGGAQQNGVGEFSVEPYCCWDGFSEAFSVSAALDAIAFDGAGNLWAVNNLGALGVYRGPSYNYWNSCAVGGGSVAIDGSGSVWATNNLSDSVSKCSNGATEISPSSGYTGGGLSNPFSIAIDSSGNVWVGNYGGNGSITEFVGAAPPVMTPIASALKNHKLGARP